MRIGSLAALLCAAFAGSTVLAGPYGDALGKCMVSATTPAEKTKLVRWLFGMMALHPDLREDSAVTAEQRTAGSKETARLFERLLTEQCEKEAREAIQYEGGATVETSFGLLGQVASRELFANPEVTRGLSEFAQYVDQEKLEKLAAPTAPAQSEPTKPKPKE